MITGAHSIIFSTNPDADRAFLRDVLKLTHVDAGEGWLIFGLPPAEVALHPSEKNDVHELYLLCDDIEAFAADMNRRNVPCTAVRDLGWGLHARPDSVAASPVGKKRGGDMKRRHRTATGRKGSGKKKAKHRSE
jgi:hypothetical protein